MASAPAKPAGQGGFSLPVAGDVRSLEVRLLDGSRVPFVNAAAHAVMYYVSWMFPLVFLVSLFEDNKRCLHDILAGVIVTRRG